MFLCSGYTCMGEGGRRDLREGRKGGRLWRKSEREGGKEGVGLEREREREREKRGRERERERGRGGVEVRIDQVE